MIFLLIIPLILIDLFTKYLSKIYLLEQKNLISDFLYLKYVENVGIAFSIPLTGYFLKIITIIIISFLIYFYIKEEKQKNNKLIDLSFVFILAGALGNGYERIFNSKVIDFVGIKYFAVFNLADVFINIGIILYLYILFCYKSKNVNK